MTNLGEKLKNLKGFLPGWFGEKAATPPKAGNDICIPLITLSAAIQPVLFSHGLKNDNKDDIAKGWEALVAAMNRTNTMLRSQATHGYLSLRNAAADIAGNIRHASDDGRDIPISKLVLTNVVDNIVYMRLMSECLGEQELDLDSVPDKITFIMPKPLAKHFPKYTEEGRQSLLLKQVYDSMTEYVVTPLANLKISQKSGMPETSGAHPHANV